MLEAGVDQPPESLRSFVEPVYGRVDPGVRETVVSRVIEVGARVQLNDFRCCDKFDIMDKIDRIETPTLVICGNEDEMTPVKYSQYLADRISGARLAIIEGSTHLVFMEKPAEVNRAIEAFLDSL